MKGLPTAVLLCAIAGGGCDRTDSGPPSSDVRKEQEKMPAARATSQSAKWNVTVVSPEGYTVSQSSLDPSISRTGLYNLKLELEFQYLGPDDRQPPPEVLVSGENGQKFETLANITLKELGGDDSVIVWLLSPHRGDPIDRPVRSGQKFGPFSFYIGDIPLGQRDLTLTFADTPPIAFHVTMRN